MVYLFNQRNKEMLNEGSMQNILKAISKIVGNEITEDMDLILN